MAIQNKETLINYFSSGQRPLGKHFEDLIDTMMHINDDELNKDSAITVAPSEDKRAVISILSKSGETVPSWTLSLEENGDLSICGVKGEGEIPAAILLKNNGDIELQGRNMITKASRKGRVVEQPADGRWHTIANGLAGCNVVEVTAAYKSGTGSYSTLMAWASHCFGKKRKIERIRPHTFFWNNKIRLRWIRVRDEKGSKTKCNLQIKTRYKAKNGKIKCSITSLMNQEDIT